MKRLVVAVLLLLAPTARAQIAVTDDVGNEVRLEKPAQRIVSLAPHATELLFAAGAGRQVIGAVQWSDYPPQAQQIPRVGGYTTLDLETIVALRPDLLVAYHSGNDPRALERLRSLGFKMYVSEIRSLEQVATGIDRLGRLAGTDAAARQASAAFRERWSRLRGQYADKPRVSVFYQIWNRPLMTINGAHLISRVMELCGGRNVFHDLGVLTPTLNLESVLVADPEAIISGGMGEARPEWVDEWRKWTQLQAVKHGHLFFIHSDLLQRPTPRVLEGAEQLCRMLDGVRQDLAARRPPLVSRRGTGLGR